MFLRKDSFRLNLYGRKPSSNRPATAATAGILILTMALCIGSMVWKNSHVISGYQRAFSTQVPKPSSWSDLVRATEARSIAEDFERSAQLLADSIALLFRTDLRILGARRNSLDLRNHRLVSSQWQDKRVRDSLSSIGHYDFLTTGYDTMYVLRDPQLSYDSTLQSLFPETAILESSSGFKKQLFLISELLTRAYSPVVVDSAVPISPSARDSIQFRFLKPSQVGQTATIFVALDFEQLIMQSPDSNRQLMTQAKRMLTLRGHVKSAIDTSIFVFMASRAGQIDTAFHVNDRKWLSQAAGSGGEIWTGPYLSYNPAITVLTVSCPMHDPLTQKLIGVVGIDLPASQLSSLMSVGTRQADNFFWLWTLTLLLLIALVSLPPDRFDELLWAFLLFLLTYTYALVGWAFDLQDQIGRDMSNLIFSSLSIVNAGALAIAAVQVFVGFRFHPFRRPTVRPFEFLSRQLDNIERSQLLTQVVGGLAASILFGLLSFLFSSWLKIQPVDILETLSIYFSALSLIVFGALFFQWQRQYFKNSFGVPVIIVFLAYAVLQLGYKLFQDQPWFWQSALILKLLSFGLVVIAIYFWSNIYLFGLVRSASSHSIILNKIASGKRNFVIAAILDKEQILFVDMLTLTQLGVPLYQDSNKRHASKDEKSPTSKVKDETLYEGMDFTRGPYFDRWIESEFGKDLFEPKDSTLLSELLHPSTLSDIRKYVHSYPPDYNTTVPMQEGTIRRHTHIWHPVEECYSAEINLHRDRERAELDSAPACAGKKRTKVIPRICFRKLVHLKGDVEGTQLSGVRASKTKHKESLGLPAVLTECTVWRDVDRKTTDVMGAEPIIYESPLYVIMVGQFIEEKEAKS